MNSLTVTHTYGSDLAFSATFTYQPSVSTQSNIGSIRVKDADTTVNTLSNSETWTVDEFISLHEEDNYDYIAGTQLYTSGSDLYWEAHLAHSTGAGLKMYLLPFDQSASGSAQYTPLEGLEVSIPAGSISTDDSLAPKLLFDTDSTPNLYAAFLTSTNAYIAKYNLTTSPAIFSLYTFTHLTASLSVSAFGNIDMVYVATPDVFIILLNDYTTPDSDNNGLYFLSIDRVSFTLSDSTYIRYDTIGGATTPGVIAFIDPSSAHQDYF
jgi:hypothetical protein